MTKVSKMTDLSEFDTVAACDRGSEIQLTSELTGNLSDVFIKIYGRDSTIFKEYLAEQRAKNIQLEVIAKRKGVPVPEDSAEQMEGRAIEIAALLTMGWRTGDNPALMCRGEELPFNHANAIKVYTAFPSIRRAVDAEAMVMANFTVS